MASSHPQRCTPLCPPAGQAAPHPDTKCRLLEVGAAAAQGLGYGLVGFFRHRRGSSDLNGRETVDCLTLACLRNPSLQTLQLPSMSPWAFLGSHHCPGTPHYCSRPAVLQWGSLFLAPHPDHWKVQWELPSLFPGSPISRRVPDWLPPVLPPTQDPSLQLWVFHPDTEAPYQSIPLRAASLRGG